MKPNTRSSSPLVCFCPLSFALGPNRSMPKLRPPHSIPSPWGRCSPPLKHRGGALNPNTTICIHQHQGWTLSVRSHKLQLTPWPCSTPKPKLKGAKPECQAWEGEQSCSLPASAPCSNAARTQVCAEQRWAAFWLQPLPWFWLEPVPRCGQDLKTSWHRALSPSPGHGHRYPSRRDAASRGVTGSPRNRGAGKMGTHMYPKIIQNKRAEAPL